MNIALFGGGFDPIHRAHLAVAKAAADTFNLKEVHFAPVGNAPHRTLTATFAARFAMAALACSADKRFIPSLIDAPGEGVEALNYTLYTVRRFKTKLRKSDRLFFLIGIDQFEEIATWHKSTELLRECEFIIAGRPGHSMAQIGAALPGPLRPGKAVLEAARKQPATGELVLPGMRLHLLSGTAFDISGTATRAALAEEKAAGRWLTPEVAEFIAKTGIYSHAQDARKASHARGSFAEMPAAPGKKDKSAANVLKFEKTSKRARGSGEE